MDIVNCKLVDVLLLVQMSFMKKILSPVVLVFMISFLLSSNQLKGQIQFFRIDTVYNSCNKAESIKIWPKKGNIDTLSIKSYYINGKVYHLPQKAKIDFECDSQELYAFLKHNDPRFIDHFILSAISCHDAKYEVIQTPKLDSATQFGSYKFRITDLKSNKDITWRYLTLYWTQDPKGERSSVSWYKKVNFQYTPERFNDTVTFRFLKPGKYTFQIHGFDYNICSVKTKPIEFWVGNQMQVEIDDQGYIRDSIYYWHPAGSKFCEVANWWDNTGCIDTIGFFYNADSNAARKYWNENGLNKWYSPPKIKEAIYYDFNSDGIIDTARTVVKRPNWFYNSKTNLIRIPSKYNKDSLTVWSKDSLGQWQSSGPIAYTNCSQFKRHDYFDFTPYYGECQFSSNGNYKSHDTLHVSIRKLSFNGNDTSYADYDAFSFQANSEIFKPLDYGHYIIERVTNNGVCDAPIFDTVVSCAGFTNIISDSAMQDSLVIYNGFTSKADSILIKVIDTLNNWTVIDSAWLGHGEHYVDVFPNGNYFVGYYSNSLDCAYERMWSIHNSSVEGLIESSIRIYPNPVNNKIKIESELTLKLYRILDLNGKLINSGSFPDNRRVINASQLPKGVYLIQLETNDGITITKEIVKM